jgi:hypothetical protein
MRARITALSIVALLVSVAPAPAQTVVNGGVPNGQPGFDIFNDFRTADDFTVTGSLGFDLIRFWGILPTGFAYTPTIFWQILADGGGGTPGGTAVASGSALAQAMLRAPIGVPGFDSWQFDLAVGPQSLGTGIYWLALHDGLAGDVTDSGLIWEMTNGGSGSDFAVEFTPADQWTGGWGGNLAYELQATPPVTSTPEPATMMLVGSGLAALGGAASRRRRALRSAHD